MIIRFYHEATDYQKSLRKLLNIAQQDNSHIN